MLNLNFRHLRLVATAFLSSLILGVAALPAIPVAPPPRCANLLMAQITSEKAIKGSLTCLSGSLLAEAQGAGITTDQLLADAIGIQGSWAYVGRSRNGGYVYEAVFSGVTYAYLVMIDAHGLVTGIR